MHLLKKIVFLLLCSLFINNFVYAGVDFESPKPKIKKVEAPKIVPLEKSKIIVDIDYTEGFELSAPASQIVIGNPLIADIKVRDEERLFIIGKSPGRTNMLVYGKDGKLLERHDVIVRDPAVYVKLYNGSRDTAHFDCVPFCQRVVRITDEGTSGTEQLGRIIQYVQSVNQLADQAIQDDLQASEN